MAEFGTVEDTFGGVWERCKPDCKLQVVRPGKVQCECDFDCPCGGHIEYHLESDLRWPQVSGWFCSKGGPFCDGVPTDGR